MLEGKFSQVPQGIIIFWDEDVGVNGLPDYLVSSRLRFGESEQNGPGGSCFQTLYIQGPYLQDGHLRDYPFKLICLQNPTIGIFVHFQDKGNNWKCERFGKIEESESLAEVERSIAREFNLPLVGVHPEEPETGEKEADSRHPTIASANPISKIKSLIRDDQDSLALQLVRSLNDPKIYEALLKDCCELSDHDEDEGWIEISELFGNHDALFYQLLALAPEEANLPGPLKAESIESIHLNQYSSLSNLNFLKQFPRLESFAMGGWGNEIAILDDISGLEGVTRLKHLQMNVSGFSSDWAPLQHLVQLRDLTLSGGSLTHPGPEVLGCLTKLKELSIDCNGAPELNGLAKLTQLKSLTLNDAKSLGSLSFLGSLQSLRCLTVNGYGGESLEGIGNCRMITEFSISNARKLEDISELGSLTRLRQLTISGKFRNLDSLKPLSSLQFLYVNDAEKLRDLSGLSGCSTLERINIYDAPALGSLWGIGQLGSLRELNISSWQSTGGYFHLHEVGGLSNLADLVVSCPNRLLRGFTAVSRLKKLRTLNLSGCNCAGVTDLSPLRGLSMLNHLEMSNCQSIKSLDPLANLKQLETLELIDCPNLASLAGLRDVDSLQRLTITGNNKIDDLFDLQNLYGLTHLALRYFHQLHDASSISELVRLEALDLEDADRLSDISFLHDLDSLDALDLSSCYRIHPEDYEHLCEDDFESLYLPDADEYDEECENDGERKNPWGKNDLNAISDEEWLRLEGKEQGVGLLQKAIAEGWLDRVPEHICAPENLLAVEALHLAAKFRDFSQIPDSLLTVENLLAEDSNHFWNVFHFAAAHESLDLLPDHFLVEKNLLVPTRSDCPLFENIFAGSTCLHIAATQSVLTLLPRSVLTSKNLLLKDERDNTPLGKAEEGLQTLKNSIADLKENEADQAKIDLLVDWLETSQIQIAHLKQQVVEMPGEVEPEPAQEEDEIADLSSEHTDQAKPFREDQLNRQNVDLFDDVLLDDGEDAEKLPNELKFETVREDVEIANAVDKVPEKSEDIERIKQNRQAADLFDDVMLDNGEPTPRTFREKADPIEQNQHIKQSVNLFEDILLDDERKAEQIRENSRTFDLEQPLCDQPDSPQEEELAKDGAVEVETNDTEISPLAMNTWFHCLEEAMAHPNVVAKLDIIHQESLEKLGMLSALPHLEEIHFIKVNISSFECLTSAKKLCHIRFESCEVSGWMGLLDLQGLEKIGCYPNRPPEKVIQLLEDKGVDIYLFAPMRVNGSEAPITSESFRETQVIQEEAFA